MRNPFGLASVTRARPLSFMRGVGVIVESVMDSDIDSDSDCVRR